VALTETRLTLEWVGPDDPQSAMGARPNREDAASRDQLFATIEELNRAADAANYPHTVLARHAATGHSLSLVVGADQSFLQFIRADDPESNPWESQGEGGEQPVLTFFAETHHSEVPASVCVPTSVALDALAEFYDSGELPRNLTWERAW
jgi:Immunity protein Imm1